MSGNPSEKGAANEKWEQQQKKTVEYEGDENTTS